MIVYRLGCGMGGGRVRKGKLFRNKGGRNKMERVNMGVALVGVMVDGNGMRGGVLFRQ